uniref:MTMR6-9 GRAM domain-containing protein n=1 Tax=Sinocyclocheilus rhinocerous TaxID=307959 RepID=A0A673G9C3_9TELE
ISSRRIQVGMLYLTATHTIFVGKGSEDRSELWVLHSLVCNVVKHKASQSGYPLLIHCKNFQVMQFIISQESDCHNVYISLSRLSRPGGSPSMHFGIVLEIYCDNDIIADKSAFVYLIQFSKVIK